MLHYAPVAGAAAQVKAKIAEYVADINANIESLAGHGACMRRCWRSECEADALNPYVVKQADGSAIRGSITFEYIGHTMPVRFQCCIDCGPRHAGHCMLNRIPRLQGVPRGHAENPRRMQAVQRLRQVLAGSLNSTCSSPPQPAPCARDAVGRVTGSCRCMLDSSCSRFDLQIAGFGASHADCAHPYSRAMQA